MHPYEFMEFVYRFYQHDMTGVPLKFYPLQYRWWNHFDKSQEYKQVDVLRISLNRGLDLARFRSLCDSVCVEVEDVRILQHLPAERPSLEPLRAGVPGDRRVGCRRRPQRLHRPRT